MKLLLATFLLLAATLTPTVDAFPPVCLVYDVGEEGGKASGEVWLTCGPRVVATACPKDGFCTTVSTEDVLP